jgi:hypothetical protein
MAYSWIATGQADTGRAALARRLFEVDGVGRCSRQAAGRPARPRTRSWSWTWTWSWSWTMLLEGCLFRLRRGGRQADVHGFLRLHEALAPTAEEVAMLTQDYGALLSSSHNAVAAVARHELTRHDPAASPPPRARP